MSADSRRRTITVGRIQPGRFIVTNERGGSITIGTGDDADFSPTELLLAAIGGCTSIDVDILTSRRAAAEKFQVVVEANKIRDDLGNRLADIAVTFHTTFPNGPKGDAAREVLPQAVRRSHDQVCTVTRTIELGTPVAPVIA